MRWFRSRDADDAWKRLLLRYFQPLPAPERAVDYVLTGADPGPLPGSYNQMLRLDGEVADVHAGLPGCEAAVVCRFGRLVEDANSYYGAWSLGWAPVAGRRWPEMLLRDMRQVRASGPLPLTFGQFTDAVACEGASVQDVLRAVCPPQPLNHAGRQGTQRLLSWLPGFADALGEQAEFVRQTLDDGTAHQKAVLLDLLSAVPQVELATFADSVAAAACSANARLREAANGLRERLGPAAVPALRRVATTADPAARARALDLLWNRLDDREFAEERAAADRAAGVRTLLDSWRLSGAPAADDPSADSTLPEVDWTVTADAVEAIVATVETAIAKAVASPPRYAGRVTPPRPDAVTRLTSRLRAALSAGEPPVVESELHRGLDGVPNISFVLVEALSAAARAGHAGPPACFIAMGVSGFFPTSEVARGSALVAPVLEAVHEASGGPDLLTLQVIADDCGLPGAEFVWHHFSHGDRAGMRHWPAEQVWPFVARNLDLIIERGRARDGDYNFDETAFIAALGTFPRPPQRVEALLYERALGVRKTERRPAQDALDDDLRRGARLLVALADGKAEVRTVAAQWLARRPEPATLQGLQKAFAKEKQDLAKAAMLDALEALGEPVEKYLEAAGLQSEAEKAAAKGWPRELAWMAWNALPAVHWSSGEPVTGVVVQYLIAQAVRAKTAEPNAILRRYASLMVEGERHELAHAVLELWVAEDVRPMPRHEAERAALTNAQSWHQWATGVPGSPTFGMTVEQLAAHSLPELMRQPAGSATGSKGVLAVVAALGGPQLVAPVERYLRDWYGMRSAQCKALLGMLAWVDDKAATQLLLSVGGRFRTRGIQDEANRLVSELAERRGWTLDELADRTVPTVGFDDTGCRSFDYGTGRTFTARLLPDATVELRDDSGSILKTLPAPRKSNDAEVAAAQRKAFTAAKKELKAVVAMQTERLHEALAVGRQWSAEDWMTYLAGHPIVRLLVARLIWVAYEGPGEYATVVASFRLLDDGTLTDVDDEPVTAKPAWRIRLAHDSNLPADIARRWLGHLSDYEVTPLFRQLGRDLLTVAESQRSEHEVSDIKGHMLSAFALRGRAVKLGWNRGPTQDGGWFYSYTKTFASSAVTASLEFSGNGLPEEDRDVALLGLRFEQEIREGHRRALPLGEVPVVLLSETWHEVRELAALGAGFDPDWESKTNY